MSASGTQELDADLGLFFGLDFPFVHSHIYKGRGIKRIPNNLNINNGAHRLPDDGDMMGAEFEDIRGHFPAFRRRDHQFLDIFHASQDQ